MKKSNYTFEVHVYAPELNKVYLNGLNVTKYFEKIKKDLTKDFASNIRLIRKTLNYKTYNHYCVGKYYSHDFIRSEILQQTDEDKKKNDAAIEQELKEPKYQPEEDDKQF